MHRSTRASGSPAGTGPEAGQAHRALPEIWKRPDDFVAAQKIFSDAAPKLLAAGNCGDVGAVEDAVRRHRRDRELSRHIPGAGRSRLNLECTAAVRGTAACANPGRRATLHAPSAQRRERSKRTMSARTRSPPGAFARSISRRPRRPARPVRYGSRRPSAFVRGLRNAQLISTRPARLVGVLFSTALFGRSERRLSRSRQQRSAQSRHGADASAAPSMSSCRLAARRLRGRDR